MSRGLTSHGGVLLSLFLASACGDAVLPSDFSGPPAGEVTGTVLPGNGGGSRDATRPRLSLEWLTDQAVAASTALHGQPLRFQRSDRLQTDWDIGLDLPSAPAKLDLGVGPRRWRVGVAKIVYYDDRVTDGRLDWGCRSSVCDEVKAVSAEYVVFVDSPLACALASPSVEARPRLGAGYHYFHYDGGVLRPARSEEAMSFTLSDRALTDNDPTAELRAFLQTLVRTYVSGSLDGC